ncbi:MAG: hypothetical protein M3494_14905 [Actinomycetota bacterium]|nr:hypothetical protein [Actinomycetota bacterium]
MAATPRTFVATILAVVVAIVAFGVAAMIPSLFAAFLAAVAVGVAPGFFWARLLVPTRDLYVRLAFSVALSFALVPAFAVFLAKVFGSGVTLPIAVAAPSLVFVAGLAASIAFGRAENEKDVPLSKVSAPLSGYALALFVPAVGMALLAFFGIVPAAPTLLPIAISSSPSPPRHTPSRHDARTTSFHPPASRAERWTRLRPPVSRAERWTRLRPPAGRGERQTGLRPPARQSPVNRPPMGRERTTELLLEKPRPPVGRSPVSRGEKLAEVRSVELRPPMSHPPAGRGGMTPGMGRLHGRDRGMRCARPASGSSEPCFSRSCSGLFCSGIISGSHSTTGRISGAEIYIRTPS